MRWLLILLALALPLGAACASAEEGSFTAKPVFDLRLRQEVLDGVLYFAEEPDANWVRLRARAGATAWTGAHSFKLLLTNEHRHVFTPKDTDFDWDEIIFDQAWWTWAFAEERKVTLGRQNIIWDQGFLMLEGHPLDGSRSIYHNAVRYEGDGLDVSFIHNPKYDSFVLAGDAHRPLTDADETALAMRFTQGHEKWTVIWKDEVDPDHILPHLQGLTLGGRTDRDVGSDGAFMLEGAFQYLNETGDPYARGGGISFALQTHLEKDLGSSWKGKLGYFHYSGDSTNDGDLRAFRTPWGRWPKWSELYIYTLIGESTPGRVHVAAWENIAAPHATVTRPLGSALKLRLNATYLLAPQTDWAARGLVTEVELKITIVKGVKGHLLWERLDPGSFHDGRDGLTPMPNTVNFLRWQLTYEL
jgi:hypothetical protein